MKKEKIYNYFYIVNNLVNGHFYLGVHSTDHFADGYFGSGKLLKVAINNYGKENFEITPLKFFGTRKELLAFEKEIVNEQFLKYYKGICYNLKKGGEGGSKKVFTDEEMKERRRESNRKYKQTPKGKESNHKAHRKYDQRPDVKEYKREYNHERNQRPEVIERNHIRKQKPEVKERNRKSQRKYDQKPEVKERRRERNQTPEHKEYMRKWYQQKKDEKLAAQQGIII